MKFNIFSLSIYIYLIIYGITISLCTSCKHILNNHEKNIDIDFVDHLNMNNENYIINEDAKKKLNYLKFENTIYFSLDKYHILPIFFSTLDMHAEFLKNHPLYQIKIEGHTDERGTPEYNIALGERRAYSIKKYLHSKGVLSNQIEIISYGKEKPIAFGHNEESYSKNRRAVILY